MKKKGTGKKKMGRIDSIVCLLFGTLVENRGNTYEKL